MKELIVRKQQPLSELNSLRSNRMMRLFICYWVITVSIGLMLPSGTQLGGFRKIFHALVGGLDGVMQVATHSFDPVFVEVFLAISMLTGLALAVTSCFWIPSGSHKIFPDAKAKLVFSSLGLLMLALALGLAIKTYSIEGLSAGRASALLYLGSSTKLGVLTILNAWFGFCQLFFFVVLRAGLTTPCGRIS